jgi:hypothetical protein
LWLKERDKNTERPKDFKKNTDQVFLEKNVVLLRKDIKRY